MTILEDLWYGNINPHETFLIQNRQFKHLLSLMGKGRDKLTDTFCFGYRPTEKFDLNYLAYVLRSESFRKEMTFLVQGISRYNISKNKVMEVEIPVPSLEEQSKVGRYFSNLDNLITLHQRKCDEEKQKKKALMQLLLTGIVRTNK